MLAFYFIEGVAGERFTGAVEAYDPPLAVEHHHECRGRIEDRREKVVAVRRFQFGVPPFLHFASQRPCQMFNPQRMGARASEVGRKHCREQQHHPGHPPGQRERGHGIHARRRDKDQRPVLVRQIKPFVYPQTARR